MDTDARMMFHNQALGIMILSVIFSIAANSDAIATYTISVLLPAKIILFFFGDEKRFQHYIVDDVYQGPKFWYGEAEAVTGSPNSFFSTGTLEVCYGYLSLTGFNSVAAPHLKEVTCSASFSMVDKLDAPKLQYVGREERAAGDKKYHLREYHTSDNPKVHYYPSLDGSTLCSFLGYKERAKAQPLDIWKVPYREFLTELEDPLNLINLRQEKPYLRGIIDLKLKGVI